MYVSFALFTGTLDAILDFQVCTKLTKRLIVDSKYTCHGFIYDNRCYT